MSGICPSPASQLHPPNSPSEAQGPTGEKLPWGHLAMTCFLRPRELPHCGSELALWGPSLSTCVSVCLCVFSCDSINCVSASDCVFVYVSVCVCFPTSPSVCVCVFVSVSLYVCVYLCACL